MHLRQENPPLCGRDHLAYRSYYFPVKVCRSFVLVRSCVLIGACVRQDCIDGDLCEQYTALPFEKQRTIAEELVRTWRVAEAAGLMVVCVRVRFVGIQPN